MRSTHLVTLAISLMGWGATGVAAATPDGPLARAAAKEVWRQAATHQQAREGVPLGEDRGGPLELRWSELAALLPGHRVTVTLIDHRRVEGEAIAVRDEALVVDVRRSSDSAGYPRGNGSIPRTSVALIGLERMRGASGRTLGTVVGVLAGITAGGYIAGTATDSAGAGIPLFLGIATAMTFGGHAIGGMADRRMTWIRVIP